MRFNTVEAVKYGEQPEKKMHSGVDGYPCIMCNTTESEVNNSVKLLLVYRFFKLMVRRMICIAKQRNCHKKNFNKIFSDTKTLK